MKHLHIDFHTHTRLSDGMLSPQALLDLAREAGIGIMAITDHDHMEDLTQLQQDNPDIRLIQGAEISCIHTAENGKETEIHMVALGVDPENPKLKAVLAKNKPDRRPYIEAILSKLRECGVDIGSYEYLHSRNPGTTHLGRMQIAKLMKEQGYVSSVDEAFDVYIGAFGQRKAFVPNPLRYVPMAEAAEAVLDAGGVPVLAHLYYYQLSEADGWNLVRDFKALVGDRGAMEVFYGCYSDSQRMELARIADAFGLMYSAASDFHGHGENETLHHQFTQESCRSLLDRLISR